MDAPERFERMVLSNTSSHFADRKMWDDRLRFAREKGLGAMVDANMERWFTKGFREREPKTIAWISEMFLTTPLEGYIACGEAVRDMDQRALLPNIKVPTLVIAGRHDPATALQAGEYLRDHYDYLFRLGRESASPPVGAVGRSARDAGIMR